MASGKVNSVGSLFGATQSLGSSNHPLSHIQRLPAELRLKIYGFLGVLDSPENLIDYNVWSSQSEGPHTKPVITIEFPVGHLIGPPKRGYVRFAAEYYAPSDATGRPEWRSRLLRNHPCVRDAANLSIASKLFAKDLLPVLYKDLEYHAHVQVLHWLDPARMFFTQHVRKVVLQDVYGRMRFPNVNYMRPVLEKAIVVCPELKEIEFTHRSSTFWPRQSEQGRSRAEEISTSLLPIFVAHKTLETITVVWDEGNDSGRLRRPENGAALSGEEFTLSSRIPGDEPREIAVVIKFPGRT